MYPVPVIVVFFKIAILILYYGVVIKYLKITVPEPPSAPINA
jgi:hypothetical protein